MVGEEKAMARICMLAFTHYSTDSRVRREAEALTARGDEVDFICLKEPGNEHVRDYHGVHLYPIGVGRYRGRSTALYLASYVSFFVCGFFLMTYLFLRKRYHIVQVHTMPDFMVFTALIPKLFGARVILDVHDLVPELYSCKFGIDMSHPLIRLLTWIERRSIAFAHRAIAVHIPHRDLLVRHGNPRDKFAVVLNVPDPRIFEIKEGSERVEDGVFRLIYHGTIAKRHGLEVAIEAVALARQHIPGLEFEILGDGDNRDSLVRLVEELGLSGCVGFSDGRVALEDLPARIRRADVGVVPIIHDAFTQYMLPVKLMEYVHLGVPVIATDSDTIKSYLDDTMICYVPSGDVKELATQIRALHDDPGKRKSLADNAGRFSNTMTWESQRSEYYGLIDGLLGETADADEADRTSRSRT